MRDVVALGHLKGETGIGYLGVLFLGVQFLCEISLRTPMLESLSPSPNPLTLSVQFWFTMSSLSVLKLGCIL